MVCDQETSLVGHRHMADQHHTGNGAAVFRLVRGKAYSGMHDTSAERSYSHFGKFEMLVAERNSYNG